MPKETWGVLVSALFAVVIGITPVPERWRPLLVSISWVLLFLACFGWLTAHYKWMLPTGAWALTVVGLSGASLAMGLYLLIARNQQTVAEPQAKTNEQMKAAVTLRDLFLTDFGPNLFRSRQDDMTLTIGSKTGKFPEKTFRFTSQLWTDLHEGTQFLGFYIPVQDKDPEEASGKTVLLCQNLPYQLPGILKMLQGLEITMPLSKGSAIKSTDLPLSRRVYIYYEGFISPQDLGTLVSKYEETQLLVEFRGSEYLAKQQLERAVQAK